MAPNSDFQATYHRGSHRVQLAGGAGKSAWFGSPSSRDQAIRKRPAQKTGGALGRLSRAISRGAAFSSRPALHGRRLIFHFDLWGGQLATDFLQAITET